MIGALLRKELRQLAPLAVGLGALVVWEVFDRFLLHSPDANFWATTSWFSGENGEFEALAWLVFGLITAYNLMPGEHDQRTIELLYMLPVHRRTVFLTKFAAGVLLLLAVTLGGALVDLLKIGLNTDSFARRQVQPSYFALELALTIALATMAVAYGMLLSFFRGLGWVLVVLVWLALELGERLHPALGLLNFKRLGHVEHHGITPLIPWKAWGVHAGMSLLALALAARLWLGRQEAFAAFYARLRGGHRLRRVVTGLLLVVAVVASVAVMSPDFGSFEGRPAGEDAGGGALRQLDTKHFRFTYRPQHEAQARFLAREAEPAYARVRERLDAPETGRIVADLTDTSAEHLGIAGWKKLRIDVRPPKPQALLRFVLYHETTHVLAGAVAEGISPERDAEARFFQEGLANYVAYGLAGREGERAHARAVAALAWARFHLRFEDLLAPRAFLARHDEYLVYALGELWVAALVDTCGPSAPRAVLVALARGSSPQTLSGRALWRQVLQEQRCDLDRVLVRHERELAALEPQARRLPVASGVFVGDGDEALTFDVQVRAPDPGPFVVVVRARENPDTPPDEIESGRAQMAPGARQRLEVPRPRLVGKRFEFQVGASTGPDTPPFFSRWQTSTLAPAP